MTVAHTPDCDSLALGRTVQALRADRIAGRIGDYNQTVDTVLDYLEGRADNHRGNCGCAKLRLGRVLDDLTLARRQQRRMTVFTPAGLQQEIDGRVTRLTQERDELRRDLEAPVTR